MLLPCGNQTRNPSVQCWQLPSEAEAPFIEPFYGKALCQHVFIQFLATLQRGERLTGYDLAPGHLALSSRAKIEAQGLQSLWFFSPLTCWNHFLP